MSQPEMDALQQQVARHERLLSGLATEVRQLAVAVEASARSSREIMREQTESFTQALREEGEQVRALLRELGTRMRR